jgi:hypothetical protein
MKNLKYLFISFTIFIIYGCTTNQLKQIVIKNKIINFERISINDNIKIEKDRQIPTIAIVFPSKIIGKYAINSTNAIISYLIYKNINFYIKVIDIHDEKKDSILNAFIELDKLKINKVLFIATKNGVKNLLFINNLDKYSIYLPLIHKDDLNLNLSNIIYGAIDYKKQLEALNGSIDNNIINLYDSSNLGINLSKKLHNINRTIIYEKAINNDNSSYHRFLKQKAELFEHSSVVLNMPIVKSSIMLSQMNAYDINTTTILSTQLNYTSLLFSLTQAKDRKNMIIANSIGKIDDIFREYNFFLNNDIIYNWVNYSVAIGTQYLLNKNISSFDSITIKNQQIIYPVTLYTTTKYSFKPLN